MRRASLWRWILTGCATLLILGIVRARYPYQVIRTAHVVVSLPRPWSRGAVYVVALLELCRQTAATAFDLSLERPAEVEIRPSWRPAFWFEPDSGRIVLCCVFGPAIDRWLFAIYFAVAHEYGHLAVTTPSPVKNEAWANLFSLYALAYVAAPAWPKRWERLLLRRDILLSLAGLYAWRWAPGRRRAIARQFWEWWRITRQNSHQITAILKSSDK